MLLYNAVESFVVSLQLYDLNQNAQTTFIAIELNP